jgi:hypothetical protein
MKPLLIVTSLIISFKGFGLVYSKSKSYFSESVQFKSLESKTLNGDPVFNEIKLFEQKEKDIWMMNQSHFGENPSPDQKDRLVIVVDKTKNPKTAYFMQIEPGELVWTEDLFLKKVNFKVSCFMCHSNGPRAIRTDLANQIKVNYLNMKIAAYKKVTESELHQKEDQALEVPFRLAGQLENEKLKLASCIECHDGIQRSILTRQNAISIQFLVQNKMMPPEAILNQSDFKKIQKFINGF